MDNSLQSQTKPKRYPAPIGHTLEQLLKLKIPDREEIFRGVARSELGVVNAIPDGGKTTLMRNLCLSAAAGRRYEPLLTSTTPRKVALLDFEDDIAQTKNDLQRMLQHLTNQERQLAKTNLLIINGTEHESQLPSASITDALKSFGPDLIVIDTVTSAFNITSENDNAEVTRINKTIRSLAKTCNAALLYTHHIGKAKAETGNTREEAYKGRGGSAFAGIPRASYNLDSEGSQVLLSAGKSKGPKFDPVRLRHNASTRWLEFVSQAPRAIPVYEHVVALFADGEPRKTGEIVSALVQAGHCQERTAKSAIAEAATIGAIRKEAHGYYVKSNCAIVQTT